jgi:hypothetical protein
LLSPILNVSFTSVFYGLSPYVNIFVGAFLLIVSAYLCKKSVEIPVETHNIIDENRDIENNKDIEIRN